MRPGRDFRFQISDFKPAGPDPPVCRFQISDPRAEQADVVYPLQISDFRFQTPECLPRMRVCQNSRCHISECRIQIPYTKEYRLEGPRRRPDNIGQIPMEKMLSPVLPMQAPHSLRMRPAASTRTRRHRRTRVILTCTRVQGGTSTRPCPGRRDIVA